MIDYSLTVGDENDGFTFPAQEVKIFEQSLLGGGVKSRSGLVQKQYAAGVGTLCVEGEDFVVGDGNVGPLAQKLYDNIYGMQTGKVEDYMGWVYPLGLKA